MIHTDTGSITFSASRERTVMAVLLLHANQTVQPSQLIEAIWATKPPPSARNLIHGCVFRIRKLLKSAEPIILTDPIGYRVTATPAHLDLLEFRQLITQARAANNCGDPTKAAASYRTALALWRGPALSGAEVGGEMMQRAAATLDEERLQALEECLDLELAAGHAGRLVPELTDLVRQHSHRESMHRMLMLALYRAGRQSDALRVYRQARQLLHDQLGVEPGSELQLLHQAILNHDPKLDVPSLSAGNRAGRPSPIPRELPADVVGFTGRTDALSALDMMLTRAESNLSSAAIIATIAGTPGVGKTALAVHWAHRAVEHFPDGQLYVDLRGYDPDRQIMPGDALARFLIALGLTDRDIPLNQEDRAARFRTELANRRMVVVLDNAATVEQVRPLLPGSGSCMVVVTSRDSLAGLVATRGALRLDLDRFSSAEAIALLRQLIGSRVDTEPDSADGLANMCARLPLALRLAAELAIGRPTVKLPDLVLEMADRRRRLELLDAGGDPRAAVKVVFSWSVQRLPRDAARTFRLIGLHPGPDIDPYAAAALIDSSFELSRRMLELLAQAHLVHANSSGRFSMHDLLRAYAIHLTATTESDSERLAALDRLFNYYVAAATAAMNSWYPGDADNRPRVLECTTPMPDLNHHERARFWLVTETSCLIATAAYSITENNPIHAIRLSRILYRYLDGGHFIDALTIHGQANYAAKQVGDLVEQAHTARYLGITYMQLGQYRTARSHIQDALRLFRRTSDLAGEGYALSSLGIIDERLDRFDSSADYQWKALALFRKVGDLSGQAIALSNVGILELKLGRYKLAAEYLQQSTPLHRTSGNWAGEASAFNNLAVVNWKRGSYEVAFNYAERALELYQALGDRQGESHALGNLASVELRQGSYAKALSHYDQSLVLDQELGNRHGEAVNIDNIGIVHIRLEQPDQASRYFRVALALFREIGIRSNEAGALNGLGEAAVIAGNYAEAVAHYTDAMAIAVRANAREQQARAHAGLGQAHNALDRRTLAHSHYEQALALYSGLDMPEAEDIHRLRASLIESPHVRNL